MSSLGARPGAITSSSWQILNYLTFGRTQVQEMVDTELGSPLPIAHVMWYFDFHLHHLKETHEPGFRAALAFIDHQPDLASNIAAVEPDSHMYLLGVFTDSLSDCVNRVQRQLNHVLTHGSKLDESGDWDQQANWTNRGIPLWVRDEKYGSDACELKEEEVVQKGQAAEAQAPAAKRKSTGEEPAPKKKETASKPQAGNSGTGEHTDESDEDEEEESEEEEEEEPQVSQGSEESGSETGVRGEPGQISIQAASSSVPTKRPACKATAKG